MNNSTMKELNEKLVDECIGYLVTAVNGNVEESDVIRMVATVVESTGGIIDACSICGAMPMTTNCNNAGCDV